MKLLPAFLQPGSSSSSSSTHRRRKTLDATTRPPQPISTLFPSSNSNGELAVPAKAALATSPSQSSFISQPPATPSSNNAAPANTTTPHRSQSTLVKPQPAPNDGMRTRRRSLRNLFGLRPQFAFEQQSHPVPALPDLVYSPASSDTASSPATSLAASDSATSNNSPLSALSPLKNGKGPGETAQYHRQPPAPPSSAAETRRTSEIHRLSLGLSTLSGEAYENQMLRYTTDTSSSFESKTSSTSSVNTVKAGKALDSPLLKLFPRSTEGHDEDGYGSDGGDSDEVGTEEAYGKPSEDGHALQSYSQQNRKEAPLPPLPPIPTSAIQFPATLSINLTKVSNSSPPSAIKMPSPRSATSAGSSTRVLSLGAKACLDLTLSRLRPEQQASSVKGPEAIGGGSTSRVYPTSSRLYLHHHEKERKVNRTLCTTLHRANIAWRLESRKLTLMEEVELDGLKRLSAKGDMVKPASPTTLAAGNDRARKDIAIKALNEAGPDDILVHPNDKQHNGGEQTTMLLIKTEKLKRQDTFMKAQVRAWRTWIERDAFEERKIVILLAEHAGTSTGISGSEAIMTVVRPVVPRHAHSLELSGRAKCLAGVQPSVYALRGQAEVGKLEKRVPAQPSSTPLLPLQSGTATSAKYLATQSSTRPSLSSSSSAPAISSLSGSTNTSAPSSFPRSSSVKDTLSTPSKRPISDLPPQTVVVTRPTPPRHSSLPPSAAVAVSSSPEARNKRVSLLSRIATTTTRPPREAPPQRPCSTMLPSPANDRPQRQISAHERSQSASVTLDIGRDGEAEDEDEMPLAYWRDRQSMVSDGSSSSTSDKGKGKRFSTISNNSNKQPSPISPANRQSLLVPPMPTKQPRQRISSSTSNSNISQNAEVAALQAEIAALKAAQAKTLQNQKEMERMKEAEFARMKEERLKASIREETARKEKEEEETRKKRDERKKWEDHRRRSAMLEHQQKEQDKAEEEARRRSSYMPSGMPGYPPPESHRQSILFPAASPPQLYQPQPIYPIGPAMQQHQQPFVHPMFYAASGGMPMHQYQPQNTFIHPNAMMSAPNLSYMPNGQMTPPYPLSFTPPATPPRYPSPRRDSPNRLSGHSFSSNEDSAAGGPLKDKRRSSYLPASQSTGKMSELLQLAQQFESEDQDREPNFSPDGLIQQATFHEQLINPRAMLARSQGRSASYDSSQSMNELSKSRGRNQAVPAPILRSMSSDPRNAQRGSRAFLDIPAQRKSVVFA